jgi:hypothetical protein
MSLPDDLAERIDDTRITYEKRGPGVTINGSAFVCEFEHEVDPESFCETVATADDPWRLFGVPHKLRGEQTDDDGAVVQSAYWKLLTTLCHVEDGDQVGASSVTLELTASWLRVYVKDDCDEHRVVEFLEAVDEEYGIDVQLPGDIEENQ